MEKKRRLGTYGNRGDLLKIWNKSRKFPHGGRDTGQIPPNISLGKSSKKHNMDRESLARPQRRPIKEAFDPSEGPQRESVLLPTHGHYVQEELYLDVNPILHMGGTLPTVRYGTRGYSNDKMEQQHKICKPHRHGEGSFDRELTLRQIYQWVRELQNGALCERASTVLQLPEVWSPCYDM